MNKKEEILELLAETDASNSKKAKRLRKIKKFVKSRDDALTESMLMSELRTFVRLQRTGKDIFKLIINDIKHKVSQLIEVTKVDKLVKIIINISIFVILSRLAVYILLDLLSIA